jgi:putative hydrolase
MPGRRSFPRFSELDDMACRIELQTHTTWTDGNQSVRDVLEATREQGIHTVAITEHVRRDTDWFDDFVSDVRREAEQFPDIAVLVGCEAKALDDAGDLDVTDALSAQCDIVLGSVHRFPDGKGGLLEFSALSADELAEREVELAVGLLRAAPIDVLAHPGGMYQRRHGEFPAAGMRTIIQASLDRGIAVELNSSYHPDLSSMIALCRELDPFVSIGSDAHDRAEVGKCSALLRRALFA